MKPSTSLGTTSNVGMANPSPSVRPMGNMRCLLMMGGVYRSSVSGDGYDVNYRCRCRGNHDGNLPEGIHLATEDEVFMRFATPSARRQWLGEQLQSLVALAKSTGQLARVLLWGSFVTSKEVPNDLDVLLVMGISYAVFCLKKKKLSTFSLPAAR